MGLFSYECKRCTKSLLSPEAARKPFEWMTHVVAVIEGGSISRGTYDGYGRIEFRSGTECELPEDERFDAYHDACWIANGKPSEWSGKNAKRARDQGWFFDDVNYLPVQKP
jgi:hypothetical protein